MAGKSSVGKRIRTFREERNVDLETLSQNTGLTVNFLERMENDEIYPTIGPLQKVARSLGVRLGTFLDDQFTRDPIISRIDQLGSVDPAMHTGRTPRSSYIYQALGKGKSDRNMEPFFIEIYPDKDEERKTISHQGEEFILVLKGELMVVYGRETYYLKAGETIYYNSIVPHYVGAHGDDPAQLLAVTYGPYYLWDVPVARNKLIPVVIAFAINYAAYFAEIYRGGIESMPVGQYEAAEVLGYTKAQTFIHIILPQVFKRVMPSITNEVVTLVKDTSMAFTVSYQEMFTIGKQISNSEASFVPFLVAGVFYFVFNAVVDFVMGRIEKRMSYYK